MAEVVNNRSPALLLVVCGALSAYHTAGCAEREPADPMRPSYVRPAHLPGGAGTPLRLQAIFGNEQQRVAVINGQVVSVGSRVGALDVMKIDAGQVELHGAAHQMVLKLPASPANAGGEIK